MQQTEIWIPSTMDSTLQPSLFYRSDLSGKRPLLVGLHTWSWDRFNQIENMLPLAEKLGFHLLLPEFRGPIWLPIQTVPRPAVRSWLSRTSRMPLTICS